MNYDFMRTGRALLRNAFNQYMEANPMPTLEDFIQRLTTGQSLAEILNEARDSAVSILKRGLALYSIN